MTTPAAPSDAAPRDPAEDLRFIREVLDRTHRRIDPHAFHFVHWGAIVIVWYPLGNHFQRAERLDLVAAVGIASLALGAALSFLTEFRRRGRPRLEGENTFVSEQVAKITGSCIAAAAVVSFVGPATRFLDGPEVPVVWGFAYAIMAYMIGVVYSREWLRSGIAIFAAALAACAVPEWNGTILGPVMGLGMIVPGWMAERRVRGMEATGAARGTGTR